MSGSGATSEPLISIVIPTRERAAKLPFTLKTVLSQGGDDFEVVVSDNASQDATRSVVAGITDARLRYVNTGRRLSVSDSFEFAIQHSCGRYLLIIGDDDGLVPDAIATLRVLVGRELAPIIYWDPPVYHWPTSNSGPRLVYYPGRSSTRVVSLGEMTRFSFRWGGLRYQRLPLLYHALVRRELLEKIRERTGRILHSTLPDVFLAFALPVFSDTALFTGKPLSVYGVSEPPLRSKRMENDGGAFARKIRRFVEEYGDYCLHPTLYPGVPFWVNMIPDTMLIARDLFPEYYHERPLDYDAMWAFLWRYWRFESVFGIAAKAAQIRAYHPFHVGRYFFFVAANALSEVRMAARRLLRSDPATSPVERWPDDIAEFVIRVHDLEQQRVA